MSIFAKPLPWGKLTLWLAVFSALLGAFLVSANLRELLAAAAGQVTWTGVLATVPGQAAAVIICAIALRVLRPGVGFAACLGSRILRDGGDNMPFFLFGFSEALGARALVLFGCQPRTAVSATVLDLLAESLALVPIAVFAAWLLWREWQLPLEWILFALAGLAILVLIWRLLRKFAISTALARRLSSEWNTFKAEVQSQRSGLPLSTGLHLVAWLMTGLQLWMAALALGYDLTPFQAVGLACAAHSGRAILFFMPAGLVGQEAGLLAAGVVFGLTAPQALALALVLRLRDVLFAFTLLAWPLLEWRHSRFK